MKITLRSILCSLLLLSALTVLAPLAFAQPAAKPAGTAAERVATQNALFEEYYALGLREFPATTIASPTTLLRPSSVITKATLSSSTA